MKTMRMEKPVKNRSGIYKRFRYDSKINKWVDTGKFRSIRRIIENGFSRKEQAVFNSFEEAWAFRSKEANKTADPKSLHRNNLNDSKSHFTFEALIQEWKPFHYLKLERSTQQTYDKLLPHLDFLKKYPVETIDISVIDKLIHYWVTEHPKSKRRNSFNAELDLLKTILGYYRRRKNPAFLIPIFEDHHQAVDIVKRAKTSVKSLSADDLGRFLEALRTGRSPQYYFVALTQFCLGLRIGEALAIYWDDLDLENRIAHINKTVDWDQYSWEATIKERPKNGNERALSIPKILATELKGLKAKRDPSVSLIFHKNGIPLIRKTIANAYNRELKRLGITHVSGTHMMRKTAATQANRVTGDFYAVSKLMDHSSPNITLKYVEEVSDQKRKVADALNSVLEKRAGENSEPKKYDTEGDVPLCPPLVPQRKLFLIKSTG